MIEPKKKLPTPFEIFALHERSKGTPLTDIKRKWTEYQAKVEEHQAKFGKLLENAKFKAGDVVRFGAGGSMRIVFVDPHTETAWCETSPGNRSPFAFDSLIKV